MALNYNKEIYKKMKLVLDKVDEMIIENEKQTQTIEKLEKMILSLEKEKRTLILEIEKLKNNNNKN